MSRRYSKLIPLNYRAQDQVRYWKKYKRYLEKCMKTVDKYIKELDSLKYGR